MIFHFRADWQKYIFNRLLKNRRFLIRMKVFFCMFNGFKSFFLITKYLKEIKRLIIIGIEYRCLVFCYFKQISHCRKTHRQIIQISSQLKNIIKTPNIFCFFFTLKILWFMILFGLALHLKAYFTLFTAFIWSRLFWSYSYLF